MWRLKFLSHKTNKNGTTDYKFSLKFVATKIRKEQYEPVSVTDLQKSDYMLIIVEKSKLNTYNSSFGTSLEYLIETKSQCSEKIEFDATSSISSLAGVKFIIKVNI